MACIMSKIKSVHIEFRISNAYGPLNLKVEINDREIIFRSLGCRTECYLEHARLNQSSISNSIYALVDRVNNQDVAYVVQEILKEIL